MVNGVADYTPIDQQWDPVQDDFQTFKFEVSQVTAPDVAISPDGSWLVFNMLGHLFRLSVGGGQAEQLTFGPYYDKEPVVAPDGSRIAFVSDRDGSSGNIHILDLSGVEIEVLTDEVEAARPTWSPDGRHIAYLAFDTPRRREPWAFFAPLLSRVKEYSLDTGSEKVLTPDLSEYHGVSYSQEGEPVWARTEREPGCRECATSFIEASSSDESHDTLAKIEGVVDYLVAVPGAAELFYRKFVTVSGEFQHDGIYARSLDSERDRLIFAGAMQNRFNWKQQFGISTDGTRVYAGDASYLWGASTQSGNGLMIPFSASVSHTARNIASAPPWEPEENGSQPIRALDSPSLSPNGSVLLFTAAGMLWRQLLDDNNAPAELISDAQIETVAWSPDGSKVAFSERLNSEKSVLKISDSNLSDVNILAEGGLLEPSWSGDGNHIVLHKDQNIISVDVATGDEKVLITSQYWYWPRLSADGKSMYSTHHTGSVFRIPVSNPEAAVPITALQGQSKNALVTSDEKWLAFRRNAELWVADLSKALVGDSLVTEDEIIRVSEKGGMVFQFTPDEKGLLFAVGGKLFRQGFLDNNTEEIPITLTLERKIQPDLLIRNVRVLDHEMGEFTQPQDILIRDGRIVQIGQLGTAFDVDVLDGNGRYAMPGLWDSHLHGGGIATERLRLLNGMTSFRDPGSPIIFALAEKDRSRIIIESYPRRFTTGEIFEGPDGDWWDWWNHISSEEDARRHVRLWKELGARIIKVYRTVPWPIQRAIADEARAQGLGVMGHSMTSESVIRSVTLGYTSVEHSSFPERYWGDVLGLLSATGTAWSPTLVERNAGAIVRRLKPEGEARVPYWPVDISVLKGSWLSQLEALREAHEMGVILLAGTDQASLLREMDILTTAGIPLADVLRIATVNAAAVVGAENYLGAIEVGKFADILLLDENPLESIRSFQALWRVVLGGKVIVPEELRSEFN